MMTLKLLSYSWRAENTGGSITPGYNNFKTKNYYWMRLSLQNTSDHVKVEFNNKLLLHYLCIILTLNMLTKGMIDVKFPFSLSVPQDITGCMFTLADII